MRAVECHTHGPPEDLRIVERDDPQPGAGEVVVQVEAAALNFPDILLVADRYQISVPVPFVPGSEFAGTVAAVGDGVDSPSIGDRVSGTVLVGAFAERVVVAADRVTPVPDEVDLRDAAAFSVTHATAYHCLRSVASLQPGERLLVLGAAGGVGSAAVALGVEMGAEVVAAASGPDRLESCRAAGAAVTVDSSVEDFRAELRAAVPNGVDVVIDPVGGRYSEAALRATRWGGRFVTVGYAAGEIPRIPLNLVLLKGVQVLGFEMAGFATHRPDDVARDRAELAALFTSGRIRPVIGATFPLDQAPEAMRALADRKAVGKVVLVP